MTRRKMIALSAATVAGWRCAGPAAVSGRQDPWRGFRMGMESYSVRNFDLDGALARYKELGIPYAEVFPKHMPPTADPAKIEAYKAKLREYGVTLWGMWGGDFTRDDAKNREVFMFARAMGAKVLVGDPRPDSFESLNGLTKEFGIKIGIHNHGPKSRYDRMADTLKAVEKWPQAIGACVDTGHVIRSGEDPVAVIRALGPRVHEVHLKDALAPSVFTVLGKGKLDVLGTLRALQDAKFDGCLALEYEEKPENPMEDLRACMKTLREAMERL